MLLLVLFVGVLKKIQHHLYVQRIEDVSVAEVYPLEDSVQVFEDHASEVVETQSAQVRIEIVKEKHQLVLKIAFIHEHQTLSERIVLEVQLIR